MDIEIDLFINGVPDQETADAIALSIRKVLNQDHNTDILVEWEEV